MKKAFALLLALLMIIPLAVSCANENPNTEERSAAELSTVSEDERSAEPASEVVSEEASSELSEEASNEEPKVYNVLFVGNSYTYYHEMPVRFFKKFAKAAGITVNVAEITNGGQYLYEFADFHDEFGSQVKKILENRKFDFVVLQEQSNNAVKNTVGFYDSVRVLNELIKENGAELVLYSTWGYGEKKTSSPKLTDIAPTTEDMEMAIRAAYAAIGDELGARVARAGAAMTYALKNTDIVLYENDYTHPTMSGSCMAAMTLVNAMFGVEPKDVDFSDISFTKEQMQQLKEIASYAVSDEAKVPTDKALVSAGKTEIVNDFVSGVDISKTVNLDKLPNSEIISVVHKESKSFGKGWEKTKGKSGFVHSGVRGDLDRIAQPLANDTAFTDDELKEIENIGYGVSVIGMGRMDSARDGWKKGIVNICNGDWGSTLMAAWYFDGNKYNVDGTKADDGRYAGLITLNFTDVKTFDAIGYMSGSFGGFPQAQDVFVSDDGISWKKVETACYDVYAMRKERKSLISIGNPFVNDFPKGNEANVQCLFSMDGETGKYIRIGVILGGKIGNILPETMTEITQHINTREIVVYGD